LKKALMFGGAFNPPTNAHIQLAEYACRKTHRDCVVFMPSKMTYIENDQHKSFAFDDETRYQMLQKIASTRDWMVVSDHEIHAEEQPRSYYSLQYLKQQGYDCSLLFGSDKLTELETGWKYIHEIAEEFGMVCMVRSNDDVAEIISQNTFLKGISSHIEIVHTPETWQNVSSSEVRVLYQEHAYDEIEKLIPAELQGLRNYK
jgi:cytidyltransferase-related domain